MSGIFDSVREQLNLIDVADYYGVDISRGKMIRCISDSHEDKTPSMKLYDENCYCFGCGKNGDVTDFISMLFDISKLEAVKKLARDFNLSVNFDAGKKDNLKYKPKTSRRDLEDKRIDEAFRVISDYRSYLEDCKEKYKPLSPEDGFHPLFAEALNNIGKCGYYLDVLTDGTREERLQFVDDIADEINRIVPILENKQPVTPETAREINQNNSSFKEENAMAKTETVNLESIEKELTAAYGDIGKHLIFEHSPADFGEKIKKHLDEAGVKSVAKIINADNSTNQWQITAIDKNDKGTYEDVSEFVTRKERGLLSEVYSTFADFMATKERDLQPIPPKTVQEINQANSNFKEERTMSNNDINIKAVAYLLENEGSGNLKANAIVTINDSFSVRNIKVVTAKDGNLAVSMPGFKGKNGEWIDSVIPTSKNAAAQIKQAVIEAYKKAVELQKEGIEQRRPELSPSDIEVKIGSVRDNYNDNKIVASTDVTVANTFVVKGVQIKAGGEDGLYVAMPNEIFTPKDGEVEVVNGVERIKPVSKDIAHAITPECGEMIKIAVMDKFMAHEQSKELPTLGNASFNEIIKDNKSDSKVKYASFSPDLAEKVAAELDKSGIQWSGRKNPDTDKTVFAVNIKDEAKLNEAILSAKAPKEVIKAVAVKYAEKKQSINDKIKDKKTQAANKEKPSPDREKNAKKAAVI